MGHLILSTAASSGASIGQGALLPLFPNALVASISGIVARLLHVSILCQSIVRINDPLTLGIISSWSLLFDLDDVMWVPHTGMGKDAIHFLERSTCRLGEDPP